MQNKSYKCRKCGSENLQFHTETTTKSTAGKIVEWLKVCNENLLLWFTYRTRARKMQKEMPLFLEKVWVCPECGEKHADHDEMATRFKLVEKIDMGVMFFWIISIAALILIWVFGFQMEGIICLYLIELIIFLLAMFVRYGLRKSIFQLQHDLIKLER